MLKDLSLQTRLTVLTGLVIIITALCLTMTSIYNADVALVRLFQPDEGVEAVNSMQLPAYSAVKPAQAVDIRKQSPANPGEYGEGGMVTAIAVTRAQEQFETSSLTYMVLIIVMGMGITFFAAGRVLKPVRDLSAVVRSINDRNLSQRVVGFSTKDEVGELADAFNAMMDRLDQAFLCQKQFVSNASHELKTPLATIKSSIQVLKLDAVPGLEDYKENVEITEQSIQRLIQVVEGLLEITTQQLDVFSEQIPLRALFSEVLSELKPFIEEKSIAVKTYDGDVILRGNHHLLYRVMFNLIENGVKYNQLGGEVTLDVIADSDQTVIRITDTGIGMDSSELCRIFEPFYRVDPSRSRQSGGTGLGLSIVKTIIEKHGGRILVQSQRGIGTTFTVVLPNTQNPSELSLVIQTKSGR